MLKPKPIKTMVDTPVLTCCVQELFNVSNRTVANWVNAGCPKISDGKFNLAAVIAWHTDRLKKAAREVQPKSQREKDKGSEWLEAYRKEKALMARLERRVRRGQLIEFSTVLQFATDAMLTAKKKIMSLRTRLPPAIEDKPREQQIAILDAELSDILDGLSQSLLKPSVDTPKAEAKPKPKAKPRTKQKSVSHKRKN